jgi:hypothetical protein
MPLAMPMRAGSTATATSFELPGNPALSPRPGINRSSNNETKPPAKPVRNVDTAQIATPAPSTRWAPKRSACRPTGAIAST